MEFKRIEIQEILENKERYLEEKVQIRGWVRNKRFNNHIGFIELTDGTNFNPIQIVISEDNNDFEKAKKLTIYSSIFVKGKVQKSEKSQQDVEILAEEINVEYACDEKYPLQNKRHSFEFLRTIAHLRPRTNTFRAVYKIRSLAAIAIHEYFSKNGYSYVHTPIITSSDAEGAGEMFRVTTLDNDNLPLTEDGKVDNKKDFFGKDAYLSVSGQLNGEALALALGKIYTFGPTFRAENSNTTRHAAEFWMIEPEVSFVDLVGLMDIAEDMLKYITKYVLENAKEELAFLDKFIQNGLIEKLENTLKNSFKRLTYTEAIEVLKNSKHKFETKVEWGMDLETEHERYLAEVEYKMPVFLTDYPSAIKAFYMRENEDNKTVAATDLLVPGIGELIGGSQREERLEVLENKMKSLGLDLDNYQWYLDLRRYGSVEHSGFGLGFERLIMYLTGMQNIRDVLLFPRTPKNCEF